MAKKKFQLETKHLLIVAVLAMFFLYFSGRQAPINYTFSTPEQCDAWRDDYMNDLSTCYYCSVCINVSGIWSATCDTTQLNSAFIAGAGCSAPAASCTDTDSSTYPTKNYLVKGTTTNAMGVFMTDSCSSNILYEKYCIASNSNEMSTQLYDCTSVGKVCENGACVSSSSICSLSNPSACPQLGPTCIDSTHLCTEAFIYNGNVYCAINEVVCGTSCVGSAGSAYCETGASECIEGYEACCSLASTCDTFSSTGDAYECDNGQWTLKQSCSDFCEEETYNYARCVECRYDSDCPNGEECKSTNVCGSPDTQSCIDTDKSTYPTINSDVKGTVTASESTSSVTDTCSGNILYEYYCTSSTNGVFSRDDIDCTTLGKVCENGACIEDTTSTCSECGGGIFNLCDSAECAAISGCTFNAFPGVDWGSCLETSGTEYLPTSTSSCVEEGDYIYKGGLEISDYDVGFWYTMYRFVTSKDNEDATLYSGAVCCEELIEKPATVDKVLYERLTNPAEFFTSTKEVKGVIQCNSPSICDSDFLNFIPELGLGSLDCIAKIVIILFGAMFILNILMGFMGAMR